MPKYFLCESRASSWAAQVPCFSHSCFLRAVEGRGLRRAGRWGQGAAGSLPVQRVHAPEAVSLTKQGARTRSLATGATTDTPTLRTRPGGHGAAAEGHASPSLWVSAAFHCQAERGMPPRRHPRIPLAPTDPPGTHGSPRHRVSCPGRCFAARSPLARPCGHVYVAGRGKAGSPVDRTLGPAQHPGSLPCELDSRVGYRHQLSDGGRSPQTTKPGSRGPGSPKRLEAGASGRVPGGVIRATATGAASARQQPPRLCPPDSEGPERRNAA